MERNKPTLEERIEALAQSTSAPQDFVRRVRDLFSRKGIGLGTSAEPFEAWLERAFSRHVETRRASAPADHDLDRLRGHIAEVNRGFRDQIDKMRNLRRAVESQTRRLKATASPAEERIERGRLVRGEWDLPMVPGPDGDQ